MTMQAITMPRSLINRLLRYAQTSPEREVCGLIGAKNGLPLSCYPITNAATTPATHFQLDAKGQIDAMRTMREQGEELFAIFHSHPNAPALPSAEDFAQAAYTEALYLIISLNTKGILKMRGFYLDTSTQRFSEVRLLLGAGDQAMGSVTPVCP